MMRFVLLVVFICMKCSAMSRNELDEFADYLHRTSQLDLNLKKGGDQDGVFDEEDEVSDHAWEDSGKFEGDLILNDRQRRLIVENVEGLSRNGLTDSTKRWPNNEVVYFIQREHFNGAQVQAIEDGIEDLARASCVKFRPYKKGDRDAVVIQGSRRGCFSQVGYQGGYQVLNLSGRHPAGRGCFRHGTVVHELLHTLGFYHMQSSPDRDDYINVVWENILQPARHNFRKYNSFSVSDFGVGYDYDSVLHYSRRAFSSNGKDTLVPKMRGAEIGQRVGLSDKDTQKLNKMYCEPDSNLLDADENATPKTKNKKKKPKNKPFEGQGIGYHQGKTVVIKVPTAMTYKLPHYPSIHVYDFSRPHQGLSTPQAQGYRIGEGLTYPYNDKDEKYLQKYGSYLPSDNKENLYSIKPNVPSYNDKQSADTEPLDKNLEEAFDKLANIAKKHLYPEMNSYTYKINKDYSGFFDPPEFIKKTNKDTEKGKYKEMLLHNGPSEHFFSNIRNKGKSEKVSNVSPLEPLGIDFKDIMDSSYRTLLPTKKPYSIYDHTETPSYATRDYLQDRDNFSNLSSKTKDGQNKPSDEDEWHKKGDLKQDSGSDESSYEDDGTTGPNKDDSLGFYGEDTTKSTEKNGATIFGSPVPLTDDWYKPSYSKPDYSPPSFTDEMFKSESYEDNR